MKSNPSNTFPLCRTEHIFSRLGSRAFLLSRACRPRERPREVNICRGPSFYNRYGVFKGTSVYRIFFWKSEFQALGFQIPWKKIFRFCHGPDREIMKPSVTIFWFRENSWESTFISFHVRNILLNILLKSVCTIIVKNLQCLLNICQKKVKLFVKCLCMKVSKTPDSSSTQLKKYTHLQCSLQIYCLFIKRFGPHRQFQQWNCQFLRLAYCCNLNLLIIYLLFSCNCYHILQRFQNNRNYYILSNAIFENWTQRAGDSFGHKSSFPRKTP